MKNNTEESSRQPLTEWIHPEKMWILGAGRFGTIAAQRLSRRYPRASFLVVDTMEEKLAEVHEKLELPIHMEDAVSFLGNHPPSDDVWVISAVPVHVAFLWLLSRLNHFGKAYSIPVPNEVDPQVPNPYRVPLGTVYTSFATFQCPDTCNEPDEICTYTKKPRLGNLFERLTQISVSEVRVVVVRSWQLAPGVGGYTGGQLKNALEEIQEDSGTYLVATSCRCHGVIDGLRWQKNRLNLGTERST
jgi:hypothetical protein